MYCKTSYSESEADSNFAINSVSDSDSDFSSFHLFIYSPVTHIININIRSYNQKRQGWLYI